ncbi:MAG TPA: plastocyanin/azurin family copper-binding protein [Planctomycetota bacterium]|nr:plastocyanin/azurin family copper-binding protein [Planctomycetota bacterium]
MTTSSLCRGSWIAMVALTSIFAGCSSDSADHQSSGTTGYRDSDKSTTAHETTVEINSQHQFMPREISIRTGETILWKNNSGDTHTVTCDPTKVTNRDDVVMPTGAKAFHSGELRPGKTYKQTFNTAGTYRYVCVMHERDGMTGTITVRPMEPQTR